MTTNDIDAIEARANAAPELDPYMTSQGGVVIFNGPFRKDIARAAVEFISKSKADNTALCAEIKRLRQELYFESEQKNLRHSAYLEEKERADKAFADIEYAQEKLKLPRTTIPFREWIDCCAGDLAGVDEVANRADKAESELKIARAALERARELVARYEERDEFINGRDLLEELAAALGEGGRP